MRAQGLGASRPCHASRARAVACRASKLSAVDMAPPDPILGVSEAFKADKSSDKLNLGVGAYRTDDLQPYVLNVVKKVRCCPRAPVSAACAADASVDTQWLSLHLHAA
jgi:hypothetical protein